jgi:hypothetical protein
MTVNIDSSLLGRDAMRLGKYLLTFLRILAFRNVRKKTGTSDLNPQQHSRVSIKSIKCPDISGLAYRLYQKGMKI